MDGEAVLRCEGCGVLHHPACWVRNDGCITPSEHRKSPIAEAYTSVRPASGAGQSSPHVSRPADPSRAPAPSRDRFAGQRPVVSEIPRPVLRRQQDAAIGEWDDDEGEVIGAPGGDHHPPDEPPLGRPVPPRRYADAGDGAPVRKPLPKVYGGHRALDYWYVPVAVALAVVVAFGVIFVADRVFGGDDGNDDTPAQVVTTVAGASPTVAGGAAPTQGASTPGSGTNSPADGTFNPGDVVVVTGSGECLNVRPAPGLDAANAPIACVPDGSELQVIGGPQQAAGLTWWSLQTPEGEQGWAAEDYLAAKQQ